MSDASTSSNQQLIEWIEDTLEGLEAVRQGRTVGWPAHIREGQKLLVALRVDETVSGGEVRSPCFTPQGDRQTDTTAGAVGITAVAPTIRPDETTRDETGWLIEVELGGRPHYWKANADARCIGELDPDANAALRLSREKDARDLALFLSVKGTIALSDVRKIKITEHMWPSSPIEPRETTTVIDVNAVMWEEVRDAIVQSPRFAEMYAAGGVLQDAVSDVVAWLKASPAEPFGKQPGDDNAA